ncbi:MAG: hypothetical protein PF436_13075 [Prolixibacteraceae bacterium]|nr:hypothetical protein [Prolixibacteraceae bacterium]
MWNTENNSRYSYAEIDTDQNLSFNITNESGYYRAILTQGGVLGAPGITLLFESEDDQD